MKRSAKQKAARAMIGMKRPFTVADVVAECGVTSSTVRDALSDLRSRGEAKLSDAPRMLRETTMRTQTWEIVGTPTLPAPAPTKRQLVWTAVRVHRTFTTRDLAASTDVPLETVKSLVRELINARIVVVTGRKQPHGQPGSFKCFRLGRDLGPDLPTARVLRAMAKERAERLAAEVAS